MFKCRITMAISFWLLNYMAKGDFITDSECENVPGTVRTYKVSLSSIREQNGEWADSFSARVVSSNSSNNIILDLTHRVAECDGKRILYARGVAREDPINSVVLTDRPLKNNEIFEVRLDKKSTLFNYSLGIGISLRSPSEIDIPSQMYKTSVAWMMHHTNIYANGTVIIKNYGRNLNDLQVGDKIGVMRSEYDALHFFVNGIDQGPAASNVPYPVYGAFELYYNAIKATIVESSSGSLLQPFNELITSKSVYGKGKKMDSEHEFYCMMSQEYGEDIFNCNSQSKCQKECHQI